MNSEDLKQTLQLLLGGLEEREVRLIAYRKVQQAAMAFGNKVGDVLGWENPALREKILPAISEFEKAIKEALK